MVRGLQRELERRGWQGEVHWNEWGRSWFLMDPLKETALEAAFIVKTMIEVSQEADAFAFWCLSDIYNQGGFQSSEFQGNYGMLSLHDLRKPAWFAHMLLERLGSERVPVAGGDDLTVALATRGKAGFQLLIAAYPQTPDVAPEQISVRVPLPAGSGKPVLTRLGATENNIIATWRNLGAPAYPTRAQISALRKTNSLQTTPDLRVEDNHAVFAMERPGVALLEF